MKLTEFSDRVTLTVAAFDIKRNNVFTLVGDVPVFNDQATRGIDANLQLRLTSNWTVVANGTAQRAVLTDNPSSPAATGKEPVGVPPHIFNLWTSYNFRVAGIKGFRVSGGVNYCDKIYGNVLNTNTAPAYTKLDAVVSYMPHDWGVSVGCRNLTDTTYFVAANGAGAFLGEPRSFFVELKATFGRK